MAFTYDVATGYALERKGVMAGYFEHFFEAAKAAQDGDHIHLICGRGNSEVHRIKCGHPGCDGTIAPFPEALCGVCRSY